jgi:hypothetical protein
MQRDVKEFYKDYVKEAEIQARFEEDSEQEELRASSKVIESSEDEFDICRHKRQRRTVVSDELDRYIKALHEKQDEDLTDPLEWWRRHQGIYPVLSKMAFDLFSIPGMSSECE